MVLLWPFFTFSLCPRRCAPFFFLSSSLAVVSPDTRQQTWVLQSGFVQFRAHSLQVLESEMCRRSSMKRGSSLRSTFPESRFTQRDARAWTGPFWTSLWFWGDSSICQGGAAALHLPVLSVGTCCSPGLWLPQRLGSHAPESLTAHSGVSNHFQPPEETSYRQFTN